jgi:DNA-binding transcriptional ArsR family regulator
LQSQPRIHYEKSLSARELRGLAHPLRFRLLELLREGPATASMLGRELGESSGATSYHLRVLARMGMVEEVPDRGTRRERWWKRPEERQVVLIASARADDAEYEAAGARMHEMFIRRDEDALDRWLEVRPHLPVDLREAAFIGNNTVYATDEELQQLTREVITAFDRLRRSAKDRPPDAVRVHVTFRSLPQELPPSD